MLYSHVHRYPKVGYVETVDQGCNKCVPLHFFRVLTSVLVLMTIVQLLKEPEPDDALVASIGTQSTLRATWRSHVYQPSSTRKTEVTLSSRQRNTPRGLLRLARMYSGRWTSRHHLWSSSPDMETVAVSAVLCMMT